MSNVRDLYQEVILDHSKRPRNFRRLAGQVRSAEGHNPLCGDRLKVYLEMDNGMVKNVGFEGSGCAISTASASMMTESVKGKTLSEIEALFERFHHLLTVGPQAGDSGALGKLAVFSGVREFPIRVKCASLAWHTLRAALAEEHKVVSTE